MLLAIDADNTNIVFAIHDSETIVAQWRMATSDTRTADEYVVWLSQLMARAGVGPEAVDGAIIASVVPQTLFSLRSLCRDFFGCEALVVGDPGMELGIDIEVERPGEVGADRLVNAIAAFVSYGGPLIILDFGTATTFDIVSESGAYRGGIIAPGVNLSIEALHRAAAKLPLIGLQRPPSVIGRGTVDAMLSGMYWGYAAMIEGLVARIRDEYGAPMKVVATGGLASLYSHATDDIAVIDKDLTIRGLAEIYRRCGAR